MMLNISAMRRTVSRLGSIIVNPDTIIPHYYYYVVGGASSACAAVAAASKSASTWASNAFNVASWSAVVAGFALSDEMMFFTIGTKSSYSCTSVGINCTKALMMLVMVEASLVAPAI